MRSSTFIILCCCICGSVTFDVIGQIRIKPKSAVLKSNSAPARQIVKIDTTIRIATLPPIFPMAKSVRCKCLNPLTGGDISELEIGGTILYFNNYFSQHPQSSMFGSFFNTLPSNATPAQPLQQSGIPQSTIFKLSSIECSSKFGGSIKYFFTVKEDYGYELNSSAYYYDLVSPTLTFYVSSTIGAMNTPGLTSTTTAFNYEIGYSEVITYKRPNSSSNITYAGLVVEKTTPAEFQNVLDTYYGALANGAATLRPFTNGLIKALNRSLFTSNTILVDAIHITEGNLDLITKAGVKVARFEIRVNDIKVNTEIGGEEFEMGIWEGLAWPYTSLGPVHLGYNEPSQWITVDRFNVSAGCGQKVFAFNFSLEEHDPLYNHDYFRIYHQYPITIDCGALNNVNPPSGLVDSGSIQDIEVYDTSTGWNVYRGDFAIEYKVYLTVR